MTRGIRDDPTGALRQVPERISALHRGETAHAYFKGTGLADNGTIDVLFKTGSKSKYSFYGVLNGDGKYWGYLMEATVSANGNQLNNRYHNQVTQISLDAEVFEGPTIDSISSTLDVAFQPNSEGGPKVTTGGRMELNQNILKPNQDYILRLVNKSGGAMDYLSQVGWHEID